MTATFWERNERELISRLDLRPATTGPEMVSNQCRFHGSGKNQHFAVNPAKGEFHCVQCDASGPVEGLAPDLVLAERGLTEATIRYFGIDVDAVPNAIRFPVKHEDITRDRCKAVPNAKGPKTWWAPGGDQAPPLYNGDAITGTEAWIVEGEPDVWIMHQAGITNVVSSTHGAGTFKPEAIDFLARKGVTTVWIVYEWDGSGRMGARKLARQLTAKRMTVNVVQLPASVGEGGDVTDLYAAAGCDDSKFKAQLKALPSQASSAPVSATSRPGAPTRIADLWKPFVDDGRLRVLDPEYERRWPERYTRAAAAVTDAPPDYHRAIALVILATVIGPFHALEPITGSPRGLRANLFMVLLGPSSRYRKSTALNIGKQVIAAIDRGAMLPGDFSPQALVARLSPRDGRGAVLVLPELMGLMKQTRSQMGFHANTQELLMELHDGDPQAMARRGKGASVQVDDPHLSFLAATTPTAFGLFGRSADLDIGLFARMQIVAPTKRPDRMAIAHLTGRERNALREVTRSLRSRRHSLL